ncbi:D-alanyl-D-alanine endopeptidase (penicillin-binding protein 7) [Fluviicoccus keumensis]|uniref:D-alanyl-D-alanine endopeptidase (Penicillin-binding protein 7) n=1 Tax=Fluviicoccus keumensis TaxID=1435465 RepID=A0A4Q7Z5U9_9GAMM|nr:D-alanyl-D-alanine endopeptidase [Fluviicoccus keumensis]RZU45231.1 D-alanyl-D-alanine endopeptidase (penicillin-binding protein 7) [Fluviicoccus keumensis]
MKARSTLWQALITGALAVSLSVSAQAGDHHDKNKNRKQSAGVVHKDKTAGKKAVVSKSHVDRKQVAQAPAKPHRVAASKPRTKEDRELARKERNREKLARISRTGKPARAARASGNRIPVQAVATAGNVLAPAVVAAPQIAQANDARIPLNLESRAALIMNAENGQILYAKNTNRTMPIASITKLMTAMVVLDAKLPLDEPITISDADVDHLRNTSSRLAVGTVLSRAELLLLALMSSENRAASALARSYPGGTPAAVAAMNRKAKAIGMENARFLDSSGLNSSNVASPSDLVKMVQAATHYPLIHRFTTTAEHAVAIRGQVQQFRNTNSLVKSDEWDIAVSKTGYINEAGRCLVMQARIKSQPVVMVLMDSWGKYTRIGDAQRVKKWLESAFSANRTRKNLPPFV